MLDIIKGLMAFPDNNAIVEKNKTITYRELEVASRKLATKLYKEHKVKGLALPKMIPIISNRCADYIIAALACWRLGIAIVPVANDIPATRIKLMLTELNANTILVTSKVADLEGYNQITASFDEKKPFSREEILKLQYEPDIAYIIYTSGTTGKPKGCVVGFESVEPTMKVYTEHFGITSKSRITFVANISFDAAMLEIISGISCSATIYIVEKDTLLNKQALVSFYEQYRISYSWLPTPVAELLMADKELKLPSTLGTLLTAGQRLTTRPPSSWKTTVVNAYGPTEATVIVTVSEVTSELETIPDIGMPLTKMECFIVDQSRKPVETGEVGELLVAGVGVARGYFNDEVKTKNSFFDFTTPDERVVRVYATGDLCRLNIDGKFEFIERKDTQVKINGYRIEVNDVLENIKQLDGVELAFVTCKMVHRQLQLLAYVTLDEACKQTEASLFAQLRYKLPTYMQPAAIILLDKMPLTANHKVDESKLPIPEVVSATALDIDLSYEQSLFLKTFKKHVGEHIGWCDDYFNVGGNSVSVISISADINRLMNKTISFEIIEQYRTPKAIWSAILESSRKLTAVQSPGSEQTLGYVPLSSSQKAIWFLSSIDPEDRAYHAKSQLRLNGDVNFNSVKYALKKVVERNGIFRTTFLKGDGEGIQCVHSEYEVDLGYIDLSSSATKKEELADLIQYTLNTPFDLSKLPLVRWSLVKLHANEFVLVHIEHHLVHDGWSYNLFLDEFVHYYNESIRGEAVRKTFPTQYADFCHTQTKWLESDEAQISFDYWKGQLINTPPAINLPRHSESHDKRAGKTIRHELPRALWQKVEQLAEKRRETPFSIMLSIYYLMLSRFSGDKDICVGSAFANRHWVNADSIIGMMINTVALRVQLEDEQSLDSLLQNSYRVVQNAQQHQAFPFECLVKKLNPKRNHGVNPFFQVFFGFHDSPMPNMQMLGVESSSVLEAIDSGAAKFDLSVVMIPREGQIGDGNPVHMLWEFKTGVYSEYLIRNMLEDYLHILDAVLSNIETSVQQVSVNSSIVRGANAPVLNNTMYQRFKSVALQSPNNEAMIHNNNTYSYAQLLSLIDSRAAYLQELPLSKGDFIGIYMERSVQAIAWMFACQAVGIGYIPLDTSYPQERIDYILEQSKTKYIVSDKESSWSKCLPVDVPERKFHETAAVDMESPMYCIYTSGSTGKPKGAVISYLAFANFIGAMDELLNLTDADTWLALTSFSFDISSLEVYLPLIKGAKIILISEGENKDANALSSYLNNKDVSYCQATPSIWKTLISINWKPGSHQTILSGGEAMDDALARSLSKSSSRAFNMYGPTETTVWSSYKQMINTSDISLGEPINNTGFLILNKSMQEIPKGAIGQLWILGDGLATGYLNNRELTEEHFVTPTATGERMYRTGDLVSIGLSNEIYYHGRLDQQVKISGYRIELEEVEQVIKRIDSVKQAAVVVRKKSDIEQLVAYVQSTEVTEAYIIDFCKRFLTPYMLPSQVVILEELPLTPNKKVDRDALPDISIADQTFYMPETSMEKKLAEMISQKLNYSVLDIESHFYKLGVNSLMAMKICFEIESEFEVSLKVKDFIEMSNIRAVAAYLELLSEEKENDEFVEEVIL